MEILLKGFTFPARFSFPTPMNEEELLQFCAINADLRIEQEPDGEILVMPLVGGDGGSLELAVGSQLTVWAGKDRRGKTFGAGTGFRLPFRFRPETPMSDDELLLFCATNDATHIEREPNGEILVMSPANSKTSKMNMRIGRLLDEWAELDGRGVAFDSSGGFTLADGSMRSPDAAWIPHKRWDVLTTAEQSSFAPVCPDFVIELRSPSEKLEEVRSKMRMWISNGAELAWLIAPDRRAVEIYRPGDSVQILSDPSSVQGNGSVAGFEIVMDRVWGK